MLAPLPTLELRFPSHQNAVELFGDRWLTRIEEVYPGLKSGPDTYLRADTRPVIAAIHLGYAPGSFHGMHVLELGPMEGMHTYQIDKLGAESVTSVETNSNTYLRCLVMKEILQYRGKFLLGDALKYLQECNSNYDLIFTAAKIILDRIAPVRRSSSFESRDGLTWVLRAQRSWTRSPMAI
jgi:hypothetical protein